MATLFQIDTFPVPELLVPRLMAEHGYTRPQAESLAREAKRMLFLHTVSGEDISPSLRIDDAWHAMLMFTRWYQDFATLIGAFIHHDPTPGIPDGGKTYARTKENYKTYFGIEPDPWAWQ